MSRQGGGSKPRIPLADGYEEDGLTRWRHFLHWAPGVRRYLKHKYNRRLRRLLKQRTIERTINDG